MNDQRLARPAMSPELWQRLKSLYQRAIELQESDRKQFVSHACQGDSRLQEELEALLEAPAQLETKDNAFLRLQELTARAAHDLTGQKIGHFSDLVPIGVGGMGEVYRATDTRLGRSVAIKVVSPGLASDENAFRRFHREALALAQLNHPNVATIFGLEEINCQKLLVMELVPGVDLSRLLSSGPLVPDRAVAIARQIASGLDSVHRLGIIHRDLKPANVMVTPEDHVKLLDFGLARFFDRAAGDDDGTAMDGAVTTPGAILGTLAYMSPEQARGVETDPRTDIWAFGCIVFEMLTGTRAFSGETQSDVLAAILRSEPPWERLPATINSNVQRCLRGCLHKDLSQRTRSIADAILDLEKVGADAPMAASGTRRSLIRRFAAGLLAATVFVVGWLYYRSRLDAERLTDKDTIVLADFANSTGDPVFDDALKKGLSIALLQSTFLNVLTDEKVGHILGLMTKPRNTPLTPAVAREVCQRSRSKAYIAGSIAPLGRSYLLGLTVLNCLNGDVLAQEQVTAASKEKVLDALSKASAVIRARLGESRSSLEKTYRPLEQVTTPSLEALHAYTQMDFERAIRLDSNFAASYWMKGIMLGNSGDSRADEYLTKAFQLRSHASEREALSIEGTYYSNVTGELDKATGALEELVTAYPRLESSMASPYVNLSNAYQAQGRYEDAVWACRKALEFVPGHIYPYLSLSSAQMALQQPQEARQTLLKAPTMPMGRPSEIAIQLYFLSFLAGDKNGMEEQSASLRKDPRLAPVSLWLDSETDAYSGHLRSSRRLSRQAAEAALQTSQKEGAATLLAGEALRDAALGNAREARDAANHALKLDPESQGVNIETALTFASLGDKGQAESLAQQVAKRRPLDTQVQSIWLPTIRGRLELSERNPVASIELLQPTVRFELAATALCINDFCAQTSCMYSTYELGEAYLVAGRGPEAATEFQKILDHNGIVANCWTGALAHLGAARSYALVSRTSNGPDSYPARLKAIGAYKEFLSQWKDADPDLSILKQARSEFAGLQ